MGTKKATLKLSRLYIGSTWTGIFVKNIYIIFYFYLYKIYNHIIHLSFYCKQKFAKRVENRVSGRREDRVATFPTRTRSF